ncbi:MAG: hypothetical protein KDB27_26295 [Planctomycetales bacterium]|nr:hypothetical protein [Planctomycetales bacterium]
MKATLSILSATAKLLVASSLLVSSVGCATFGGLPGFSIGSDGDPAPASPHGVCTVEIRDGGKAEKTTIALTPESRVQTVLDESGAAKKFRKMKVYVVRQSPRHELEEVKLSSTVDAKTGKVTLETDYAIVAGDRVVVVEDRSTALDKTLSAILPF